MKKTLFLLVLLVYLTACSDQGSSKTPVNSINGNKIPEYVVKAQTARTLATSYNAIIDDITTVYESQSETRAQGALQNALAKAQALQDPTILTKIDSLAADLENGDDPKASAIEVIQYMAIQLEEECIASANAITEDAAPTIMEKRNAYAAKTNNLTSISQDIEGMLSASSNTLATQYGQSALKKTKEYGSADLLEAVDQVVAESEEGKLQSETAFTYYATIVDEALSSCDEYTALAIENVKYVK